MGKNKSEPVCANVRACDERAYRREPDAHADREPAYIRQTGRYGPSTRPLAHSMNTGGSNRWT
jgi:hypothetical protein